MTRILNWFRFIFGGQALVARLWREQRGMREDLRIQGGDIEKLKAIIAEQQLAAYRPPQPEEPQRKVVQCRTMKEFNTIREREMENSNAD